jgi:hypothetical protein
VDTVAINAVTTLSICGRGGGGGVLSSLKGLLSVELGVQVLWSELVAVSDETGQTE